MRMATSQNCPLIANLRFAHLALLRCKPCNEGKPTAVHISGWEGGSRRLLLASVAASMTAAAAATLAPDAACAVLQGAVLFVGARLRLLPATLVLDLFKPIAVHTPTITTVTAINLCGTTHIAMAESCSRAQISTGSGTSTSSSHA